MRQRSRGIPSGNKAISVDVIEFAAGGIGERIPLLNLPHIASPIGIGKAVETHRNAAGSVVPEFTVIAASSSWSEKLLQVT